MTMDRISRLSGLGRVAVGLAVIGGLVALFNVWSDHGRSGTLDWGHVALAIGVPVFMYVTMRSAHAKAVRERSDATSGKSQ